MPEVADPGQEHRRAGGLGDRDDVGVADRATRLGEGGDPGREAGLDGVGEREEGIRAADRPVGRLRAESDRARSTAWRAASTRLVWPEPSPTSRPSRTSTMRVRRDAADEPPGEVEVAPLAAVGRARRGAPSNVAGSSGAVSGGRDEHGAAGGPDRAERIGRARPSVGHRQTSRRATGRRRAGGSASPPGRSSAAASKAGRDDDLEEDRAERLGQRRVDRSRSGRRRRRTPRPGRRPAPPPRRRAASAVRRRRMGSCA